MPTVSPVPGPEVSAPGGHLNAAVLVEGCRSLDGYTPSALENGTYLLPPRLSTKVLD